MSDPSSAIEPKKSSVRWVVAAPLLVAVALAVILGVRWWYIHSRGVEVRVTNVDTEQLKSVVVRVTGRSYGIGDLAPGATRAVYANPTSESSVDISYVDEAGHEIGLQAGGYFEPGYTGWIDVHVTRQSARRVREKIEMY